MSYNGDSLNFFVQYNLNFKNRKHWKKKPAPIWKYYIDAYRCLVNFLNTIIQSKSIYKWKSIVPRWILSLQTSFKCIQCRLNVWMNANLLITKIDLHSIFANKIHTSLCLPHESEARKKRNDCCPRIVHIITSNAKLKDPKEKPNKIAYI